MTIRVMRPNEVKDVLGISKSKLFELTNPNSPRFDSTFPARIRIGSTVGWLENEIEAWVLSCKEQK